MAVKSPPLLCMEYKDSCGSNRLEISPNFSYDDCTRISFALHDEHTSPISYKSPVPLEKEQKCSDPPYVYAIGAKELANQVHLPQQALNQASSLWKSFEDK